MKVSIYQTLEVDEQQRKAIARHVDGDEAKPRPATRDEMKAFIWFHGAEWASHLSGSFASGDPEDDDEDLLGLEDLL